MVRQKTSKVVSLLGGLGYISIIIQWMWLIALCLPWFMSLEIMQVKEPTPHVVATANNEFSVMGLAIAIIIMVIVLVLTVYVLSKLPGYVVRQSSSAVHATRDMVLPKVTAHKKISKRKKIELSSQILFVSKLALSITPFFGLYAAMMTRPPLSSEVVLAAGLFLLFWSLVLIVAQRVVAQIKGVDYSISL